MSFTVVITYELAAKEEMEHLTASARFETMPQVLDWIRTSTMGNPFALITVIRDPEVDATLDGDRKHRRKA